MSEKKYTSGPWTIMKESNGDMAIFGSESCIGIARDLSHQGNNTEANAKLMSSAPDLLSVCIELLYNSPESKIAPTLRGRIVAAVNRATWE